MTTIDLTSFDYILVNSSAGKDSQAMLDYVYGRALAAGVADRIIVVHADLGRVEWEGTRELAEEHAAHYGVKFECVARQQNDLLDHVEARGKWPGQATRYCTSDHKRAPIRKVMTRLSREAGRPVRILNCMGLRAQESANRAKKTAFAFNESASCGVRQVFDWLPIHDWSEIQVWETIRAAGTRHHKAYDLGMPRLSCCFCIFAPRPALILAGKHNRNLLDMYVEVEAKIGHTFRQDLSMAEVKAAVEAGETAGAMSSVWNM